ncbi:DUF736 family protein, partial [Bradyrhizobium liaoningense]|uniref:DUF736 family protein n=1 Tax=Bradyrhizobium liaoningense TaxID=43992 RepID=UPI002012384D
WTLIPGSRLDADHPENGVLIPCRNTVKLDDPSFSAPIYASLVKVEGEEGFTLIWSRRSGD